MGRQNCDPTIMHSSIALLQERFRQVEKAKEMRQQRQLLRLLSEAEQVKSAKAYEPSRPFFHSELTHSPGQPLQGPVYLQPNTENEHTHLQINETANWANLRSKNTVTHIANNFDESDVDTSLHL
ncbi:hypothetical protein P3X46_027275 [Hevea brasiliensis]|uniref:MYB-CC type transcription factor LHEQLE-containing domain-containing protein n=1 Tax=Hevea brasiliensis TaxID=3981 RepID=A0ABQ9KZB5_HEVBR|nr:hypothetical protein P3X46_027275 [Hevea brasiliensis]